MYSKPYGLSRGVFYFSPMEEVQHIWVETNEGLQRHFSFRDFSAALSFVLAVGREAEMSKHHPDIFIAYNKVILTLCTKEKGGAITEKDHALAFKIDTIYGK